MVSMHSCKLSILRTSYIIISQSLVLLHFVLQVLLGFKIFAIFRINNCPFLLDLAHQNLDLLLQRVLLAELLLSAFTLATNRAHSLSHVTWEVCLRGVILLLYSMR